MSDIRLILGLVVFVVAIIGGNFATAKWLLGRISAVDNRGRDGHARLHERVDGVKDGFVRKDDYREYMVRMETSLTQINQRLDKILERMSEKAE